MNKQQFLDLIRSNIQDHEFHVTIVNSAIQPRFAYTIGLTRLLGFELIFAGGIIFLKNDLWLIFDTIVGQLKKHRNLLNRKVAVDNLGSFSFAPVDPSWSKIMMLGVYDYYKTDAINAFQIIPDAEHHTLDIPHMSDKWGGPSDPVWRWLDDVWTYAVPENSTVATNIAVMMGEPITEVTRWEENEWEMFAGEGTEVEKDDMRVVSLGTIFGIDKTLISAIDLPIGKGLWRLDGDAEWNNWG